MSFSEIYDKYWSSGLQADPHWSNERIKKEFSSIYGSESIIDYGCGLISRKYGDVLAKSSTRYAGADISPLIVRQNIAEGFECHEIDPQSGKVNIPEATFSGAVCCEVFEHLYDPLSAAQEIYRLLKPGGNFVAMVPNFGYLAWRVQAVLRAQVPHEPQDPRNNAFNGVHIRYFSKRTFQRLLNDAGFKKIRIVPHDSSTIWDIFRGLGRLAKVSDLARKKFPSFLHLLWLQRLWPDVFAMRLKALAQK